MAQNVLMPQLGESVTEGTIGQWLKKPGDHVEKYESLLEVLTDKVNAEVPSPASGTLVKILVEEGQTVPVGTVICEMDVEGEEPASIEAKAPERAPSVEKPPSSPAPRVAASVAEPPPAAARTGVRYSPAVRRLAHEHGVDPGAIPGTGAGGRVTRNDVRQFIEQKVQAPPVPKIAPAAGAPAVVEEGDTLSPVSSIRKVIAERMVRSKQTVPHAWLMVEADVSKLVAFREAQKAAFKEREGTSLTYLPFMLRAVVEALRAVPIVNAQWNGDTIVMKKRINIGIAAATDRGLVVPVVKDADQKNIVGLAKAVQDLTVRARNGKLTMDDLTGGTFTVDNTGAVGTLLTYPVINAPEVAIVTMESIVKRPVVVGDAIAIRSLVNLCISFDHRVVDGADAALFVNKVKQSLEAIGPETSLY